MIPTGRPIALALLAVLAASPSGCAGGKVRADAEVPVQELPVYDATQAHLFDDSIAPEVFGLEVDRIPPKQDKQLLKRSQQADHVSRVKLRTIREERFGDTLRYRIVVQPLGPPLVGGPVHSQGEEEIELTVGRASPSLSLLRSMTVEVVGARFVLLLKRFQLNGEQVLHFRGEADEEAIIDAIVAANAPTSLPL